MVLLSIKLITRSQSLESNQKVIITYCFFQNLITKLHTLFYCMDYEWRNLAIHKFALSIKLGQTQGFCNEYDQCIVNLFSEALMKKLRKASPPGTI